MGRSHRWRARENSAPNLIASKVLDGGWLIIVAELLDGSWTDLFNAPLEARSEELRQKLCALMRKMHRNGMIHKDICDMNTMVKTDSDGTPRFKLIDFDCAGCAEEVKFIHRAPLLRHWLDVQDGTAIIMGV